MASVQGTILSFLVLPTDGDGKSELLVGYTDRVVRAFRWEDSSESSENISGQLVLLKKWLLEGQVGSPVCGHPCRRYLCSSEARGSGNKQKKSQVQKQPP